MSDRRRLARAIGAAALAGGLLALIACEDSTSGADREAAAAVAEGGVGVDGGPTTDAADGGATAGDSSTPPTGLSDCSTCAVTTCKAQLTACGDDCANALDCMDGCDTISCQEDCLEKIETPTAITLKACLGASCTNECKPFHLLALAVQAYSAADCGQLQACAPSNFALQWASLDDCQQHDIEQMTWMYLLPGSGATGTRYLDCATATFGASCEDYVSARLELACMVRGTHGGGEPCMSNAQCESGFCSKHDFSCGTCVAPPTLGAACIDGWCGWGMVCNPSNQCVYTARAGEPCDDLTAPCQAPYFCSSSKLCTHYATSAGAACGSSTSSPTCDFYDGFLCTSSTSGTCTSYLIAGSGETCGFVGSTYYRCRQEAACTGGICPAPPDIGGACDDANGPFCTYPAYCVAGRCTALPDAASCK